MNRLRSVLAALVLLSFIASAWAQDTVTYFYPDATGSPVAATDEHGNLLWREDYAPYGERLRQEVSPRSNRIWFTGHHQDDDSGLIYAGARHYDPVTGRLLSVDPAGTLSENSFAFNRYAYANNNPYRYIDPNGETPVLGVVVVGGGLALVAGYAGCDSCQESMRRLASSAIDAVGGAKNWYLAAQLQGFSTINSIISGGGKGQQNSSAGSNSTPASASPPPNDDDSNKRELTREEKKAIKTYEKRIAEHEQKIADFKTNPTVRPGMEGQPQQVIQRQQADRIRHLETEIRTFRGNIDKILKGK